MKKFLINSFLLENNAKEKNVRIINIENNPRSTTSFFHEAVENNTTLLAV